MSKRAAKTSGPGRPLCLRRRRCKAVPCLTYSVLRSKRRVPFRDYALCLVWQLARRADRRCTRVKRLIRRGEQSREPAWKEKPSWYLVATEDKMIPPDAQRQMSQRAGSTVIDL